MSADDLPPDRWELTAPESYLLRFTGLDPRGLEAFRLALMDLVARDALRLEGALVPRRVGSGRRAVWLLAAGPRAEEATERALAPVLEVADRARRERGRIGVRSTAPEVTIEGALLEDVRKAGMRELGRFKRYLDHDVAGALQERGLLSPIGRRTAEGERADEELDRWLKLGRTRFPRWAVDRADPSRALGYLAGAGAAVLLVRAAYPGLALVGPLDDRAFAALDTSMAAIGLGDGGGDGGGL